MKKLAAVAVFGLVRGLQFEVGFWIAVFGAFIPALVAVFLWSAVYGAGQGTIVGYSLSQMISYYLLATMLSSLAQYEADWVLWYGIRDGSVSSVLLAPVTGWKYFVFHRVGRSIPLAIGQSMVTVFVSLLLGVEWFVPSFQRIALFTAFVLAGTYLGALISVLRGSLAFWLQDLGPLGWLDRIAIAFVAGAYLPLEFFPTPLRNIAEALPFSCVVYSPIRIYLGLERSLSLETLKLACWVAMLTLVTEKVWRRGTRWYQAAGG